MGGARWFAGTCVLCVACGGGAVGQVGATEDAGPVLPDSATHPARDAAEEPPPSPIDAGLDAPSPEDASSDAPGDGAHDAGFVTAAHTALPQVPNMGGPRLEHVQLVTITFSGYTHDAEMKAFGDWVVTSHWLSTVGADYGLGLGSHVHVALNESAPASITTPGIISFITGKLADGTLPGGLQTQPSNYLYAVYYPPGTTIDGTDFCFQGHGGTAWHDSAQNGVASFAYAVMPTCMLDDRSILELASAHELIEAASDAYPLASPAYQMPKTSSWYQVGEIGDLCELSPPLADPAGFTVPYVYSNTAAAAGGWPCIPAPAMPYYNVSAGPDVVHTVAAGQSITLPLVGWSTAPVGDWTVTAFPLAYDASGNPVSFDTTVSPASLNNGRSATLTISVPQGTSGTSGAVLLLSGHGRSEEWGLWSVGIQVP